MHQFFERKNACARFIKKAGFFCSVRYLKFSGRAGFFFAIRRAGFGCGYFVYLSCCSGFLLDLD
jgi:hypothetical protein